MTSDFVDNLPCTVYMVLHTKLSQMTVVKLFTRSGWTWHEISTDEIEIAMNGVAELVIASRNPMLISGGVSVEAESIIQIEEILENAGIDFEFDLFDTTDKLIRSRASTLDG